ncbi:hypothetical protein JTE90_014679 [Oedothorax gibbosus]|uniref:Uncharacterized protein n=1 Tax=Oedothorax gibbosus TaxID=931172 RepID=A0AAV6UHZ2_9ARAC|nr:hypothetical protein JTE90_014679 [Oedothorax gibbosus]
MHIKLLFVACYLLSLSQTSASKQMDWCRPEFCGFVSCVSSERLCSFPNAKRIDKGGMCGCCDACVLVKKRGQQCFALSENLGFLDIECEEGTKCDIGSLTCQ